MPRSRSKERNADSTKTTTGGSTAMSTTFTQIDDDALAAILADTRQRGVYDVQLENFLNAGIAAAQVNLEEGELAGRQPQSIKTGFEGAVARAKESKGYWEPAGKGLPEGVASVRVIAKNADEKKGTKNAVYLVLQHTEDIPAADTE